MGENLEMKNLEATAEQGDAEAQFNLGRMYCQGEGTEVNYEKVLYWWEKVAEQGDADAQYNVGYMYYFCKGTEVNYEKALYWFEKAAEQGKTFAQFYLGSMYYDGEGTEVNYEKALYWYEKAAEQGDEDAQLNLSNMYYVGRGTKLDYEKALYWCEKAAEQGMAVAQFNLGCQYNIGKGTKKNYEKALYWWTKAAEQGQVDAQFNLGNSYNNGKGTKVNYEKALYWYEKAAEQGDADAQCRVGRKYYDGEGTEVNFEKALYWYEKAAAQESRLRMARSELLHLHKMNDDTFGFLVYAPGNNLRSLKKHSFFGKEENLVIELEGGVEDTITEAQKKAYAEYLEKEDELFKKFTEVLKASGTDRTALPKTLYIDIEGNYGWFCHAQWNKRYIGVLLSEDTPHILTQNQLRHYRNRNKLIELEDFRNEERYSYGSGYAWGNEIGIDVYRKDHSLEEMLPLINKLVESLNDKDAFVKALIDGGMLELAEQWVACIEEETEDSTEERRGYMVDNETAVYLPISEEDFADSLTFSGITVSYDEEAEDISARIFIDCDPDYFAGHSIEIYMDSKGNIDVFGLAG